MSLRRVTFFDGFDSETTPSTVTVGTESFLSGSGVPVSTLGLDGDKYIDLDDGKVYERTSGVWSQVGTLNLESVSGDFVIAGNLTVNGTTTTINSTELETTDANITINKDGTEASAIAGNAGITIEMSDADDAIISYDDNCPTKFKIGTVTDAKCVVDESTPQLVSNKAIVTPSRSDVKQDTKANLDIYADTASNGQLVFATDLKKLFQVVDGDLAELNDGGESRLLINQTAHGFGQFEQVSLQTSGLFVGGDITVESLLPTHTIVEVVDVDNFWIMADTIANVESHGFTVGEKYYTDLSGNVTTTRPTAVGEYICQAFIPLSPDHLQILNTQTPILNTALNGTLPPIPHFEATRTSGAINVPTNVNTTINFPDVINNTGFSATTLGPNGGYVIPEDGLYNVNFNMLFASSTAWTENEYMQMMIGHYDSSGVFIRTRVLDRRYQDSGFAWAGGMVTFSVLAGEEITFFINQVSDVTLATYIASEIYPRMSITKVGNNQSTMLPSVVTTGTMKKQTKSLSSDITTNLATPIDLQFNNLVIGNTYQIVYNFYFRTTGIEGSNLARIKDGAGNILAVARIGNNPDGSNYSGTAYFESQFGVTIGPFIATDTQIVVESHSIDAGDAIKGNGTTEQTHATIYEIPMNINEVTEF